MIGLYLTTALLLISTNGMMATATVTTTTNEHDSQTHLQCENTAMLPLGNSLLGAFPLDLHSTSISLSKDGRTLASSSPGSDRGGNNAGAVIVYALSSDDTTWIQRGDIITGEFAEDMMGDGVELSADGGRLIIGTARNDGTTGDRAGHVRIYDFNPWLSLWQLIGEINGVSNVDFSGVSVATSYDGSIIAIGAHLNDANGFDAGQVRVFRQNGTAWVQLGDDLLGEAPMDYFGIHMSLSADGFTLAVGAHSSDSVNHNSGQVRVFTFNEDIGNWQRKGNAIDDFARNAAAGRRLDMSADGNIVAILSDESNKGIVHVFHYVVHDGGTSSWDQMGKNITGTQSDDWIGSDVALSADGQRVAIGAANNGDNSGHVRLYDFCGHWKLVGMDLEGTSGGQSGFSVAISGDGSVVASGSPTNSDAGYAAGHARVFMIAASPTAQPTAVPSSSEPTHEPSAIPSNKPSSKPTSKPTSEPTDVPSAEPSAYPTHPTIVPTTEPSSQPSSLPTCIPSAKPTGDPTGQPSKLPTGGPSSQPTVSPSGKPTGAPSSTPTGAPSGVGDCRFDEWLRMGKIIAGDQVGDQRGHDVALARLGKFLAVSAPKSDEGGTNAGAVTVYGWDAGWNHWVQHGNTIVGEFSHDMMGSGASVAISADGGRLVIGASRNPGNTGDTAGHVRVFEYNAENDLWLTLAEIDGEANIDMSGIAVAACCNDGRVIAIGAHMNDGSALDAGHIRVYEDKHEEGWVQMGPDIEGLFAGTNTGKTMSLSADGLTLAYGPVVPPEMLHPLTTDEELPSIPLGGQHLRRMSTTSSMNTGEKNEAHIAATNSNARLEQRLRVVAYDRTQGDWVTVGNDIDVNAIDVGICESISMNPNATIIAEGSVHNGVGTIRVYQRNPAAAEGNHDQWVQLGDDITGEDGDDWSRVDVSLSADGNRLAIGAANYDGAGTDSGLVRIYDFDRLSWRQNGPDHAEDSPGSRSGFSVSLSGDGSQVATGSPHSTNGHVGVFKLVCLDGRSCPLNVEEFAQAIVDQHPKDEPRQMSATRAGQYPESPNGETCMSNCGDWDTLFKSTIPALHVENYNAISVTMYNATQNYEGNIVFPPIICNGTVANDIAVELTDISSRHKDITVTYPCQGNDWVVGKCQSGHQALCVGCSNPCTFRTRDYSMSCLDSDLDDPMKDSFNAVVFGFEESCAKSKSQVTTFLNALPKADNRAYFVGIRKGGGSFGCGSTCSDLTTFTTSYLPVLFMNGEIVTSITLATWTPDHFAEPVTCSGSNVQDMMLQFTKSSTREKNDYVEFQCTPTQVAKVGKCSSGLPAFCIDCTNPCTDFDQNYTVNCLQGGVQNAAQLLYIESGPLIRFPDIISATYTPLKTSITSELTFSDEGSFVILALPASQSFQPDSAHYIVSQGGEVVDIPLPQLALNHTITNLEPATSYDIFIATFSVTGQPMSVQYIKHDLVETLCCREVVMSLNSHFRAGVPQLNALSFGIGNVQMGDGEEVVVNIEPIPLGDTEVARSSSSPSFSKTTVRFTNISQSIVNIHHIEEEVGHYCIKFVLSGTSAYMYELSSLFGNTYCYYVLDAQQQPPVPQLQYAKFSNDGRIIEAGFDSPTDRADRQDADIGDCSMIFETIGLGPHTKCKWISDSVVHIFLVASGGEKLAEIGDLLMLHNYTIKAKCMASNCSGWDFAPAKAVVIEKPYAPVKPSCNMMCPNGVEDGEDFSCAFNTGNAGGRPFSSVVMSMTYVDTNDSAVTGIVNISSEAYPPNDLSDFFVYPSYEMSVGYSYNVVMRFCSFLGVCGRSSHQFLVKKASNKPIVQLQTADRVCRGDEVTVHAHAYVRRRDGSEDSNNMSYTYSVYVNGTLIPKLTVMDGKSSLFYIPPYSLPAESTVKVIVNAFHNPSGRSSTASTLIYVKKGDLIGQLSPAASLVPLNRRGLVLFDGGGSSDSDVPNKTGVNAGLIFNWQCEHLYPIGYEVECDGLNMACTDSSCEMSVRKKDSPDIDNHIFLITLTVSHLMHSDPRVVQLSRTVRIDPPSAPFVHVVTSSDASAAQSSRKNLPIKADVIAIGKGRIEFDGDFWDLKDAIMSPRSVHWTEESDGVPRSHAIIAVINHKLLPRSNYGFVVSVTNDNGFVTTTKIDIEPKTPPTIGAFQVTPHIGYAMWTEFVMKLTSCESKYLPLKYLFHICSPTDEACDAFNSFPQQINRKVTLLGAGSDISNYDKVVQGMVYDAEDTTNSELAVVRVEPHHKGSISVVDLMQETDHLTDEVEVENRIPLIADAMNYIICSDAPNCADLNRKNCSLVTNTCGMCLEGFNGQNGSSNTKCLSPVDSTEELEFVLKKRTSGPNVQSFPLLHEKACDDRCSIYGSCQFVSTLFSEKSNKNRIVSTCSVLDATCQPECVCNEGFNGLGCEQSSDEFNRNNNQYKSYLKLIAKQISDQHASRQTVIGWLRKLSTVARHALDLSEETKVQVVELTCQTLPYVQRLQLSDEDVRSHIVKILEVAAPRSIHSPAIEKYRHLLTYFPQQVLKEFQVGQYSQEISSAQGGVFDVNADWFNGLTTITSVAGHKVTLSSAQAGTLVITEGSALRTSDSQINALTVSTNIPDTINAVDHIDVSFQKGFVNESEQHYVTYCEKGVENTTEYDCPTGIPLTATCNGKWRGEIHSACSYFTRVSRCESLTEGDMTGGQCTMVSSTDVETVCRCDRRGTADGISSFSVASYDNVTYYDEHSVNVVDKDDDDDLTGGEIAGIVVGCLVAVAIAFFGCVIAANKN